VYRTFTAAPGAGISLQLADLGHPRGSNNPAVDAALLRQGRRFFDAYLKGEGKPPRHGSVLAYTQSCPAVAGGSSERFRAENWERLHPRTVTLRHRGRQRVSSRAGNPHTAATIDPIGSPGACATVAAERAKGTAVLQRRFHRPFTMLGMPIVQAQIRTRGRGGLIAARLWDVHGGQQVLVSRGVYRLRDNQRGRLLFQLFGNGWRFAPGHTAKLELLGRDPHYLRTSNFEFSYRLSDTRVDLPGR
jgi:hypothetical protein